jgi:dTDP-glucose 4,6-dehydratase
MGTSFTNIVSETEDRPGKDQAYMLASSKLREEIGWKDLIGLGNGLRRTVSWLEDNLISFRDSDLSYRVKVANN